MSNDSGHSYRSFMGWVALWGTLILAATGCQTVHWSKGDWEKSNWFKKKKSDTEKAMAVPQKFTAIWVDAVYETDSAGQTRGFGGRLYFYDEKNETCKVNGELVIYAYDDTLTDGSHKKADRMFVFKPEELAQYYSETHLGHSYSIWLPWDAVGGESKQIALIPIFKDVSGKMVKGVMNVNNLPGRKRKEDTTVKADGHFVKYASAVNPEENDQVVYVGEEGAPSTPKQMRVTTLTPPSGVPENVLVRQKTVEATAPPMIFNQLQEKARELQAQTVGPPALPTEDRDPWAFPQTVQPALQSEGTVAPVQYSGANPGQPGQIAPASGVGGLPRETNAKPANRPTRNEGFGVPGSLSR